MITTEFGALECVTVMQSAFDDSVTMAHIRQRIVVSSIGKKKPLKSAPNEPKVVETKFRYVWAETDDGNTVDDVNKVLAASKELRINRIRGCELFSILTPDQISWYEGQDAPARLKLETNWTNDRLSTNNDNVPWLFGELQVEQYHQDLLVDEIGLHGDVDFRQRDHDVLLTEKVAEEALKEADQSAPALTELAQIGARRI